MSKATLQSALVYVYTLAGTVFLVLLRLLLVPGLAAYPLVPMPLPIIWGVWLGGWRAGLVATVFGYFAFGFTFIEPHSLLFFLRPGEPTRLLLFALTAAFVIVLGEMVRHAQRQAREAREGLIRQLEEKQALYVQLRATNAKLHARIAELDTLLKILPVAVCTADPQCQQIIGNAATYRLLQLPFGTNLSLDSPAGQQLCTHRSCVDGHEIPRDELPIRRVARTGEPVTNFVHEIVFDDGRTIDVLCNAAQLRGPDNEVLGIVAAYVDITSSRRAERELTESLKRERERAAELETVMRATPTPIWIAHDRNCTRVSGNLASYQLLGIPEGANASASGPPSELQLRSFQEYRDGIPLAAKELPLQRAAANDVEVANVELSFRFDDGTTKHIYGNAVPLYDADGQVRGAIAGFVEITELKVAEAALREADRHKDEFLALLAHELRNPLAPIRNTIRLLQLGDDVAPSVRPALYTLEDQVEQMVRLIDDLLDVSRISQGKLELRLQTVDLASVVRRSIETSRPHIDDKRHKLQVSQPAGTVYLQADAVRLAQVFSNLLNNAAKYTPQGGEIRLEVEVHDRDVTVSVRDNGIGIAAEHLSRICDLFMQVENAGGGLGIGLTLVSRLVELHGGALVAYSEGLGKGSEFSVRLPRVLAPTASVVEKPAFPAADTERLRILVADDRELIADSTAQLLKLRGHEVCVAYNGSQALELGASFEPSVVLLDIGMPILNGYDVAQRMRQQPWGQSAVLVALTGWGQEHDRQRAFAAGFDLHLIKPLEPAAIMEQVMRFRANGVAGSASG